jgi:thioredoxin-related protein
MLNTPVALKYQAEYLPKYVLLDGEGNVVRAADGLLRPREFIAWLERGETPRAGGG